MTFGEPVARRVDIAIVDDTTRRIAVGGRQ